MYTGIVAGTAPIVEILECDSMRTFAVDMSGFDEDLKIGASVSLDGVCMTVVSKENGIVAFDAISETLERTTLSERRVGDLLNVERSLRVGDELGGHILSGHIIGTSKILNREAVGDGLDLLISIPDDFSQFVLEKGYIAIDGMSLTVGKCNEDSFYLHIIPETLRITSIGSKAPGDMVNIEIDSRTQAVVETMIRMGGES